MTGFRSLDNSTYETVLDLSAVCYLRLSKENYSNRALLALVEPCWSCSFALLSYAVLFGSEQIK